MGVGCVCVCVRAHGMGWSVVGWGGHRDMEGYPWKLKGYWNTGGCEPPGQDAGNSAPLPTLMIWDNMEFESRIQPEFHIENPRASLLPSSLSGTGGAPQTVLKRPLDHSPILAACLSATARLWDCPESEL